MEGELSRADERSRRMAAHRARARLPFCWAGLSEFARASLLAERRGMSDFSGIFGGYAPVCGSNSSIENSKDMEYSNEIRCGNYFVMPNDETDLSCAVYFHGLLF